MQATITNIIGTAFDKIVAEPNGEKEMREAYLASLMEEYWQYSKGDAVEVIYDLIKEGTLGILSVKDDKAKIPEYSVPISSLKNDIVGRIEYSMAMDEELITEATIRQWVKDQLEA